MKENFLVTNLSFHKTSYWLCGKKTKTNVLQVSTMYNDDTLYIEFKFEVNKFDNLTKVAVDVVGKFMSIFYVSC